MKRMLPLLIVLILLAGCAGGNQPRSVEYAAVDNLVTRLSEIMRTGDSGRLSEVLAAQVNVSGAIKTKEEYIRGFEDARLFIKSVERYDFTNRKIVLGDNVAVVEVWITAEMTVFLAGRVYGEGPGKFELKKFADGWRFTGIDINVKPMNK